MRRTLALSVLAALLWGGVSIAAPAVSLCSIVGTQGRDILAGTKGHDVICALRGADYVHADGKGDRIFGMAGADTLVGGRGRDLIVGGSGNDVLFSIDQKRSNDRIRGGMGNDKCFIDQGDQVRNCEHVFIGNRPETTNALSSSVLGIAILGQEAQETPGPQPQPQPPPTGGFPACTPPPAIPPDFC